MGFIRDMILRPILQQIQKDQVWLPTKWQLQAENSCRKYQSLEQEKILWLPPRLHSTQGWKRRKNKGINSNKNKTFSWKLKKKNKNHQYWYGHTEDATFQGNICLVNTLSICDRKITQTYEDGKTGLCTGVSTFTRGGGRKSGFASSPARCYTVSLNGKSLLLLWSPSFCSGWSLLEDCLAASNPCVYISPAPCGHAISHLWSGPSCISSPLVSSWGFCH